MRRESIIFSDHPTLWIFCLDFKQVENQVEKYEESEIEAWC